MYVATVSHRNPAAFQRQSQLAANMSDAIEWRLDSINADDPLLQTLVRPQHKTLIITCRSHSQGGHCHRTLDQRATLLKMACDLWQPTHLDIECDLADTLWHWLSRHHPHIKLLLSQHNFIDTPDDLSATLNALRTYPHHSIKLATTARSDLDALRMLALCHQEKTFTGICMGKHGIHTRLLSPLVRNQFHYHSASSIAVAPGQYGIHQAQRHIKAHTLLYGLLGDPVAKSIGDQFHHAYFKQHNINAVYAKWQINKEQLPKAISALKQLPVHGLSITTPLKHAIMTHADTLAPCVQDMHACNTLHRSNQRWHAYNTDGPAAIDLLQPWQQPQRSCHILGAGATAISIATACLQQGWDVSLYARRIPVNHPLSASIKPLSTATTLPDRAIVINTIPSQTPDFPSDLGKGFKKGMVLLDCAYQPTASALSPMAAQMGCHVIDGKSLFEAQAKRQQQHWQDTTHDALTDNRSL